MSANLLLNFLNTGDGVLNLMYVMRKIKGREKERKRDEEEEDEGERGRLKHKRCLGAFLSVWFIDNIE